jgi:hypothetical protein
MWASAALPLVLVASSAAGCALLPKKSVQDAVAAAPNEARTPPPAGRMFFEGRGGAP